MYCRNCGTQLPDHSKFCSNCGAAQGESFTQEKKKKIPGGFFMGVAACALVLLALGMFGGDKEEKPVEEQMQAAASEKTVPETKAPAPTQPPVETEAPNLPPEEGWHEEGKDRYYYSDGEMLIGLQEIDNELYYFYEDGSLAVNTTVDYGGNMLEAGKDGHLTAVTFAIIDGEWSEDKYRFGNNGRSSIKILETEVTNCDKTGFYIEANGLRGAKVNCNWKIHVRSHGKWVFVKEVYFNEPSCTFTINFDKPMDFDAITAYPTVQGNASYSSYFALVDVHMGI